MICVHADVSVGVWYLLIFYDNKSVFDNLSPEGWFWQHANNFETCHLTGVLYLAVNHPHLLCN